MTYGELIRNLRKSLSPIMGSGESGAVIRIMFEFLKGWTPVDMIVNETREVSDYIKRKSDEILARLLAHEPIQYITGEGRFCGMKIKVAPGVLIPRPETEELVDEIVKRNERRRDLRVLDIATGSGCIAVSLARRLLFPEVTAVDISEEALNIAKENACGLHVRVDFLKEDIFVWNPGKDSYDIIVSNPPYIDESEKRDMERRVLDYEPHLALFVPDEDPLCFYRRILDIAKFSLSPGGQLYFEINPRHHEELESMAIYSGFSEVEIWKDSFGKMRFLSAVKKEDR